MFVEQAIENCFQGKTQNGFLYELREDFPAFAGHFEGHPLLPAVCQMSFCSSAASRLLNKSVEVKK
jgi:3-hydroxymyristoyl/3-hydroxydecanoyl-(acyl carrier protein) dehydratase